MGMESKPFKTHDKLCPRCCLLLHFVIPIQGFVKRYHKPHCSTRRRSIWRARGGDLELWDSEVPPRITGMDSRNCLSFWKVCGKINVRSSPQHEMISDWEIWFVFECMLQAWNKGPFSCQSVFVDIIYFVCLCTPQVDDEEAIPAAKSRPLAAIAAAMETWTFVALKKHKKGRAWLLTSMPWLVRCPWFQTVSCVCVNLRLTRTQQFWPLET